MRRNPVIVIALATGALALAVSAQDRELTLMSAYSNLAPRVEKARSALRRGRLDKCEEEAWACLRQLPEHQEAHFLLSQVLYKKGEYDGALEHIRAAEEGSAKMAMAVSVLEQRKRKNQSEEMIRLSDEIADLAAAAATVKGRGACLPDKYDQALRDTKHELASEEEGRNKSDPTGEAAGVPALYHFWHGNILFMLKQPAEAEAQYRSAIRTDPDFGETYNNLINLLFMGGRVDEAREILTQAEARKAKVHPELKKAVLAK
jgi:pentatricopeptide repeat protein